VDKVQFIYEDISTVELPRLQHRSWGSPFRQHFAHKIGYDHTHRFGVRF